jgi:hypothetical protein
MVVVIRFKIDEIKGGLLRAFVFVFNRLDGAYGYAVSRAFVYVARHRRVRAVEKNSFVNDEFRARIGYLYPLVRRFGIFKYRGRIVHFLNYFAIVWIACLAYRTFFYRTVFA